jgi:hypothetical protein
MAKRNNGRTGMKRAIVVACMLLACETMLSCGVEAQVIETQEQRGYAPQSNRPPKVRTVRVKDVFKTANVRSAPSINSSIILQVPGGMELAALSDDGEWIKVKLLLEDNSVVFGYMDKELIETE